MRLSIQSITNTKRTAHTSGLTADWELHFEITGIAIRENIVITAILWYSKYVWTWELWYEIDRGYGIKFDYKYISIYFGDIGTKYTISLDFWT